MNLGLGMLKCSLECPQNKLLVKTAGYLPTSARKLCGCGVFLNRKKLEDILAI